MAINNQDKTEIHNLPEVTTLQPGMMVAVDSEPTGTKSFNLTTALEDKASASDVTDLATAVAGKADASDLTAIATTVEGKADASDVTALETAMEGKADASTTYTKTEVDQAITGIKAVPASTPSDEGKVLSVDASGDATWGTIREVPTATVADVGKALKADADRIPTWTTISEVPYSTASNAGNILTVNANGTPGWAKDNTAIVLIDQTQSASVRAAQFADIIAQGKKPAIIYSCDLAPSQSLSFFAIYQYDNASNQHIFTGTSLLDDTNYHVMPRIYTIIVSISSDFLSSGASTFENGSLCYDYLSGDAPSTEITVKNNTLTEVSSSITNNISTLTITIESVYQRKANAAIELNPINSDLTLTVKFGSSTLRHSVSAGTTLTAGKYYQVTAVGNSWTVAEFAS